jgi:plastocyanin
LSIQAVSGSGQEGRADRQLALPLQVRVSRDGLPVGGIEVAWETEDGALAATGASDADGLASARWTLPPRNGQVQARARLTDPDGAEAVFTAVAWFPLIEKVSGDLQTGTVGETLPHPLQVRVTRNGAPLFGERVQWSFLPEGVLSGPDGIASVPWTLGSSAGSELATVKIDLMVGPAAFFTAIANPGPLAVLRLEPVKSFMGGSATYWAPALPLNFRITAEDAYGNSLKDIPVAWSISGGTGHAGAVAVTGFEGNVAVEVTPEAGHRGAITVSAVADGAEPASVAYRHADFIFLDADGWGDYLNTNSVTVEPGATIRWFNEGLEAHSLAPAAAAETATVIARGALFEHAFAGAGTYEWTCTRHDWEKFTIIVGP